MAKKIEKTVKSEVENNDSDLIFLTEHFAKQLKRLDPIKDADVIQQIHYTLDQIENA